MWCTRIAKELLLLQLITSLCSIVNGNSLPLVDSESEGSATTAAPIVTGTPLKCFHYKDGQGLEQTPNPAVKTKDEDRALLSCSSPAHFCYSLWTISPQNLDAPVGNGTRATAESSTSSDTEFIKQGCWESSPRSKCIQSNCTTVVVVKKEDQIKDHPGAAINKTTLPPPPRPSTIQQQQAESQSTPDHPHHHFCCCSTPGCNSVVYLEYIEEEEVVPIPLPKGSIGNGIIFLCISVGIIFVLGNVAVCYCSRAYLKKRQGALIRTRGGKGMQQGSELMGGCGSAGGGASVLDKLLVDKANRVGDSSMDGPCFELNSSCIVLGNEIARGKYGRVHNGLLSGRKVALKLYSVENLQFYNNEKWIYSVLQPYDSQTCNIVEYYGWQEFGSNCVLALERIENGNLRDLLQNAEVEISLETCLKLMRGVSNGLGYLHSGGSNGITIVHRDLNSRNILVDNMFNVRIADFGLSLTTVGHTYSFNGIERIAEFSSLAEAGTLRYMAPELLEGAVNLKDCENALKQADVYSLALVLWETANTCPALHISSHTTIYSLPYEVELGKDLDWEQLSRFVVTRRDRPSFSTFRSSSLTRTLRDTLSESWDSEPEARLTALCIHQRLLDLRSSLDTTDLVTPLEPEHSNWTGRNPLLERNLYSSTDSSNEYLIMSQKQMMSSIRGGQGPGGQGEVTGDGASSTVESQDTTHTELSNNNTIQFFNNLR